MILDNMIIDNLIRQFVKERNEAAGSYDVAKFRAFWKKWRKLGAYQIPLAVSDEVVEVIMRKMVYNSIGFDRYQKQEAKRWLLDHCLTTDLMI